MHLLQALSGCVHYRWEVEKTELDWSECYNEQFQPPIDQRVVEAGRDLWSQVLNRGLICTRMFVFYTAQSSLMAQWLNRAFVFQRQIFFLCPSHSASKLSPDYQSTSKGSLYFSPSSSAAGPASMLGGGRGAIAMAWPVLTLQLWKP